jgi:hypothetical protein
VVPTAGQVTLFKTEIMKYKTTQERIKPYKVGIWILGLCLFLSVLSNALQLCDRMYQQKKINALQITCEPVQVKIQPADTETYGLYYPKKHKKLIKSKN